MKWGDTPEPERRRVDTELENKRKLRLEQVLQHGEQVAHTGEKGP